uniref:Uncharacterized protein n=1 Tax=Rhizophagus irregularis (strain DAOM 181602 / DAOM 197198 / MUCL 43194) TaxID=747089 RepID=U9TBZ0_RHIID
MSTNLFDNSNIFSNLFNYLFSLFPTNYEHIEVLASVNPAKSNIDMMHKIVGLQNIKVLDIPQFSVVSKAKRRIPRNLLRTSAYSI